MPCNRLPGGGIACSRDRRSPPPCHVCGDYPGYQCDGHVGGGRTCDRHLCERHAHEVAPDRHYCPDCLQASQAAQQQRSLPLFTEVR